MTVAKLRHPRTSVEVEVDDLIISECLWTCAAARRHGLLRAFVPVESAALTAGAVGANGGTWVTVKDGALGTGIFVQTRPAPDGDAGVTLDALDVAALADHVTVGRGQTFQSLPAGAIWAAAVNAALGGKAYGSLGEGAYLHAPPLVGEYVFRGQTLGQVAIDLMDLTGQEWRITEQGRINWRPPVGDLYAPLLTEGRDIVVLGRTPEAADLIGRVIAYDTNGVEARAEALHLIGNPAAREITITVNTTDYATLTTIAQQTLARSWWESVTWELGLLPQVTLASGLVTGVPLYGGGAALSGGGVPLVGGGGTYVPGTIDYTHWETIREGDLIRFWATSRATGKYTVLARVLERRWSHSLPYPVLTCQQIPLYDTQTVYAGRNGATIVTNRPIDVVREIATGIATATPQYVTPDVLTSVPDSKIPSMDALKLTGTIAAGRLPNAGTQADATTWADATAQSEFNALLAKLRTNNLIS